MRPAMPMVAYIVDDNVDADEREAYSSGSSQGSS